MSPPCPIYETPFVRLYRGDARELLPDLLPILEVNRERTVLLTDPVWPNPGKVQLAGAEDPTGLISSTRPSLARAASRWIVILGCDSDPRFLYEAVPPELPFLRTTWLRYAVPAYKGQVLNGADVAYVFGRFPMAFKGQKVFPGEVVSTSSRVRERWQAKHPCPRLFDHVVGLARGYTRMTDTLLDPFAGSGPLVEVCVRERRQGIFLEVDPGHCEEIVARAEWAAQQATLPLEARPLEQQKLALGTSSAARTRSSAPSPPHPAR